MPTKSRQQLLDELAAAVRSAGQGGPTTAEQVRTFLTSLIDELLARPTDPAAAALKVGDTASIQLHQAASEEGTLTADLVFSSTPEISLAVDPAGGGLRAELAPAVRHLLPLFVGPATDSRFLFYAAGQAYAFAEPVAAVAYAKTNALTGLFVFRDHVTAPLELLHNCAYDLSGFDSVVSSGGAPNFTAAGGARASLKIRRIIRSGTAEGNTVLLSDAGTDVQIEGDTLVDSTGTSQGIFVRAGAKLRYRGNLEARQGTQWAIAQHGLGCATDFVGNLLTDIPSSEAIGLYCLGGTFDFNGRIDVQGQGIMARFHPDAAGNPWLRLHLTGSSTKDRGLLIHNPQPGRFYFSGLIDMRESLSDDPNMACGFYVSQPYWIDFMLENVTILTKPGIPSLKGQTNVVSNFPVPVAGTFYASEPPQPGEFLLANLTPYRFPASAATPLPTSPPSEVPPPVSAGA